MDPQELGFRIRQIRSSRRMTQQAVADKAGITRLAYMKIERGESAPRVSTLQGIAAALDVKTVDLLVPAGRLEHVRFRSSKRMTGRDALLAVVARWLEDYRSLEEILQEKQEYRFDGYVCGPTEGIDRLDRARQIAADARSRLGLDRREPVRDIAGLIESCGIKLFTTRFTSDGFFGMSVTGGDGGPAIIVNTWERIPVERWIFTAAHELGHLLMHLDSYRVEILEENAEQEEEANLFASMFLMPEESFQSEWADSCGLPLVKRVLKVKRIFHVSYKSVLCRLADVYGEEIWKKFYLLYKRDYGFSWSGREEMEGVGVGAFRHAPENHRAKEKETLSDSDFRDDRPARLVRMAIESGLISISRGAEILRTDLSGMRSMIAAWV
ncbi:MAG: ImmA/IrrE family metallo-endopeptidase [Clostridia bacterium]|nr:ImmA/IrrE family metallo-endopeptidase [Clostridia bacterium]